MNRNLVMGMNRGKRGKRNAGLWLMLRYAFRHLKAPVPRDESHGQRGSWLMNRHASRVLRSMNRRGERSVSAPVCNRRRERTER